MQSNLPADMNKHTMDDGDDHRNGDGDRSKSSSLPPQPGFEAAVADMRSANNRMGIGTARIIAPQETYVGKGKGRAQNPISAGSPGSGGLGQRIQQQHKGRSDVAFGPLLPSDQASFNSDPDSDNEEAPRAGELVNQPSASQFSRKLAPTREQLSADNADSVLTPGVGGQRPGGTSISVAPQASNGPAASLSNSSATPRPPLTFAYMTLYMKNHGARQEAKRKERDRLRVEAQNKKMKEEEARRAEYVRLTQENAEKAMRDARKWRRGATREEAQDEVHRWIPCYETATRYKTVAELKAEEETGIVDKKAGWVSPWYKEVLEPGCIIFYQLKAAKDSRTKPDITHIECVVLVLMTLPGRSASLADILDGIVDFFPWYQSLAPPEIESLNVAIERDLGTKTKTYDCPFQFVDTRSVDPNSVYDRRKYRVYTLPPGKENVVFEYLYAENSPRTWKHPTPLTAMPSNEKPNPFLSLPSELWMLIHKPLRLPGVVHVALYRDEEGEFPRLFLAKLVGEVDNSRSIGCHIINDGIMASTKAALLPKIEILLPLVSGNKEQYEIVCDEFFRHNIFVIHGAHHRGFHSHPRPVSPLLRSAPFLAYKFLGGIGRAGRKFLYHFEFSMTGSPRQEEHMCEMLKLLGESTRLHKLVITIDMSVIGNRYRKIVPLIPGLDHLRRFRGIAEVEITLTHSFKALRRYLDGNIIPKMKLPKADEYSPALVSTPASITEPLSS